LLGVFLVLAALLHLWWLPLMRERWHTLETRAKAARAGLLVVAEKLRSLAVLGACAMLLVLGLVAASGWLAGTDAAWPKAVIGAMALAQAAAAAIGKEYGAWLGVLGLAGAALSLWAAARAARRRVEAAWMERASQVHDELRADPAKLELLRADAELAPLVQRLEDIIGELRLLDDSPPQQQRAAALRVSLQEVLSVLAVQAASKRLDATAAAGQATADEVAPQGAWARLRGVLASPQLGRDLGLVKKPLSWVTTMLLVVSLVGWSAEPLADSLRLAVNNLEVQLVEREAARDFEQALSRIEAPAEAPPADAVAAAATPVGLQRAALLSARAAMHAMTRAPLLERSAGLRRAPAGAAVADAAQAAARAQAGAEYVRAALAEQTLPDVPRAAEAAADAHDGASRMRSEVGAELKAQLAGGAEAVRAAKAAEAASPAMRHLQTEAERTLASLQARNPNALAALLARLEARYAQPMTPLDAQGKLMGRLIDTVFDTVDAKPEGELGKQGQKLAKAFGNKALETWAEAKLKAVLADALTGAARPEVLRAFAFRADADGARFIEALVDAERSGWQPAARAAEEARVARAVAEKVAELHPGLPAAERASLVDSLAGYDRTFVPDLGPPPAAPLGLAVADALPGAPGGGGGGGGGGQPKARASSHGTSFHAASRSPRVRGVIVGREADGPALDVVDLRWTLVPPARPETPTRVAIELRIADKLGALPTWRPAGSYSAGVLNQALRYAADGRVVATTITGGDGHAIRRLTYLHPVLVDTPLGCRVVEADRWVDTFTLGDARSGALLPPVLRELASDREQMMRWLTVAKLSERAALDSERGSCPLSAVRQAVERRQLGQVRLSKPLQQALDTLVTERRTATGAASIGLLERTARCAAQTTADLADCVCEQAATKLPERYWFPEDHTSQVREKPLALAPTLAWLAPTADRLGYLDFWVHTTLSLREAAGGERDSAQSAAIDFPAEQLKAVRALVAGRLRAHLAVAGRSDIEGFMAPLEEFVLAQRLARAALSGRLGPDFPLPRLLALERETRFFVTTQPTIRWEAVGSPRALLTQLEQTDQGAAQRYRSFFEDQIQRAQRKAPICGAASR